MATMPTPTIRTSFLPSLALLFVFLAGCILAADETGTPPEADAGATYTVKADIELVLNGSAEDADGHVVKYEWDFDGDGVYDWESDVGVATHTYDTPGTYDAKLRVTDNDGNETVQTVKVVVLPNLLPVAHAGGPYDTVPDGPVLLSGSATDADGHVVKYEWDFDGDGTYDWESATEGEVSHAFSTVGSRTVSLRVTDDDGNTVVASSTVVVKGWAAVAAMPTPRYAMAAAGIDGKVYVVGGHDGIFDMLATLEIYAPVANSWTTGASMSTPRFHPAAAATNGNVYVVGGHDNDQYLSSMEVYDPATNTWSAAAPMSSPRYQPAAAAIGGKLYVVGGYDGDSALSSMEIYDTATNAWMVGEPMPTPQYEHAAAAVDGKLCVVGGDGGLPTLKMYDPATGVWTIGKPIPTLRYQPTAATIGGKVYVMGGFGSDDLTKVEIYDPAADEWTTGESMPTLRLEHAAAVCNDKVYVVGGYLGYIMDLLEVYDPTTNTWTPGAPAAGSIDVRSSARLVSRPIGRPFMATTGRSSLRFRYRAN